MPSNLSSHLRRSFKFAVVLVGGVSLPVSASAEVATVMWQRENCEYVLIQKADGYGLIMQFSAERLLPDDVIESEFQFSVNSGKMFTNTKTGETGMLRGVKFGLTRAQALKSFPKSCKAPAE